MGAMNGILKNWNIAKVNEDKTTKVVVTIP
jgi:hypothetical protein